MTLRKALNLIVATGGSVDIFKIHATAETQLAGDIKEFRREGAKIVWIDFKDFDMPDTVEERAAAVKDAGADWLTVHAHGGPKMVEAAVKYGPPFIIAVTLLSGTTDEMVAELYNPDGIDPASQTEQRSGNRQACPLGPAAAHTALVCAPTQVGMISAMPAFNSMVKIVPGTRSRRRRPPRPKAGRHALQRRYQRRRLFGRRPPNHQGDRPARALEAMALEIGPAIKQRITAGTWKVENSMTDKKQILAMNTIAQIRGLTPSDYAHRRMSLEEFRHIGEVCQAIWFHSGDKTAPHAELTSGKCSDGFVDTLRILRFTNLCTILAEQLLLVIREQSKYNYSTGDHGIGWVIGSDHAGAALSHEVARFLEAQHDFTEKGPDKTQVWKRFTIDPDEPILQVEELITTTGTLQAVRDGSALSPSTNSTPSSSPISWQPWSTARLCMNLKTPPSSTSYTMTSPYGIRLNVRSAKQAHPASSPKPERTGCV